MCVCEGRGDDTRSCNSVSLPYIYRSSPVAASCSQAPSRGHRSDARVCSSIGKVTGTWQARAGHILCRAGTRSVPGRRTFCILCRAGTLAALTFAVAVHPFPAISGGAQHQRNPDRRPRRDGARGPHQDASKTALALSPASQCAFLSRPRRWCAPCLALLGTRRPSHSHALPRTAPRPLPWAAPRNVPSQSRCWNFSSTTSPAAK